MRMLSRIIPVVALAALTLSPKLGAQDRRSGDAFRWYIGPQGGTIIFETPNQTKGAIPSVGGHFLIMARRTGLLLSFDEGITQDQKTSFADPSAPGGVRNVTVQRSAQVLRGAGRVSLPRPSAALPGSRPRNSADWQRVSPEHRHAGRERQPDVRCQLSGELWIRHRTHWAASQGRRNRDLRAGSGHDWTGLRQAADGRFIRLRRRYPNQPRLSSRGCDQRLLEDLRAETRTGAIQWIAPAFLVSRLPYPRTRHPGRAPYGKTERPFRGLGKPDARRGSDGPFGRRLVRHYHDRSA